MVPVTLALLRVSAAGVDDAVVLLLLPQPARAIAAASAAIEMPTVRFFHMDFSSLDRVHWVTCRWVTCFGPPLNAASPRSRWSTSPPPRQYRRSPGQARPLLPGTSATRHGA